MPLFAQDEKADMICETLSNLRSAVVKSQKPSSTSLPDSDNFSRLDPQLAISFVRLTAYAARDVVSCYNANEADWRALVKSLKHQVDYRDRIPTTIDRYFDYYRSRPSDQNSSAGDRGIVLLLPDNCVTSENYSVSTI